MGQFWLISGQDDQLWSSTELSDYAVNRLQQHDHAYPFAHLAYENAGHLIRSPYLPTTGDSVIHPVSGAKLTFGGTPAGNDFANADSWGAFAYIFAGES